MGYEHPEVLFYDIWSLGSSSIHRAHISLELCSIWLVEQVAPFLELDGSFEGIQGNILHYHLHPFINAVVSELLTEETCHKTQAGKDPSLASSPQFYLFWNKTTLEQLD